MITLQIIFADAEIDLFGLDMQRIYVPLNSHVSMAL